jgi:hypothetical protein
MFFIFFFFFIVLWFFFYYWFSMFRYNWLSWLLLFLGWMLSSVNNLSRYLKRSSFFRFYFLYNLRLFWLDLFLFFNYSLYSLSWGFYFFCNRFWLLSFFFSRYWSLCLSFRGSSRSRSFPTYNFFFSLLSFLSI